MVSALADEAFQIDHGLGLAIVGIIGTGFIGTVSWIVKTLWSATQTLAQVSAEFTDHENRIQRLERAEDQRKP